MYSETITKLINQFEKLPGIGHKTAVRLAFFILESPKSYAEEMSKTLIDAKDKVKFCSKCYNITETDPCDICSSNKRDDSTICVVENVKDVVAMEKTHEYKGLYHVLHGSISPMNNITAGDIKIKELLQRLSDVKIKPARPVWENPSGAGPGGFFVSVCPETRKNYEKITYIIWKHDN